MGIEDILRPKSREEIDQTVIGLIEDTPTLPEFIKDWELYYHQVLKAYNYVTQLMGEPPQDVYVIDVKNPLWPLIKDKIDDFEYSYHPIKNIKFMGGPYSHALVKKNSKVAELYGGSLSAVMVGLEHLVDLITGK